VGLGDFFRRRHERESAIPPSARIEQPSEALGSFASPDEQPVVGRQMGGTPLGPMIEKAIAEGDVQVEPGGSQTIDMRGTGLREEILEIMRQHGIDAESGAASGSVDASDYGDMQRQLLEALARHGIDPGASGTSIDFRIEEEE
jgi:protein-tyrosine-phosphatase